MDSPLKVLYMNRRLRLAAEPQTGRREVSALTDARKTLAYDFFRILRAPLVVLAREGPFGPRILGNPALLGGQAVNCCL